GGGAGIGIGSTSATIVVLWVVDPSQGGRIEIRDGIGMILASSDWQASPPSGAVTLTLALGADGVTVSTMVTGTEVSATMTGVTPPATPSAWLMSDAAASFGTV